jgi:pimeloyl-ACP methyl ester carboxylesterase
MTADLDCAIYCYSTYWNTADFDHILNADNVWAGVKILPDKTVIAFRGSTTPQDWFRDFQAKMINDPELGGVEQGFFTGLQATLGAFEKVADLNKPVVITGHSLGAARALLFAAMLRLLNVHCSATVFGSPRPGGLKLKYILSDVTIRSFRNNSDPVTMVPVPLPDFEYWHPIDFIQLNPVSVPDDTWILLKDHHIQNYIVGLTLCN